jgi:CheY-like chemotaxis protein
VAGLTILVVDDDADTRACVAEILEAEKLAVIAVRTGREALEALERERPALLIVDYDISDMTADEFLAAKTSRPAISAIPVIVSTAYTSVVVQGTITAILHKPFDVDDLLAAVRRCLLPQDASG